MKKLIISVLTLVLWGQTHAQFGPVPTGTDNQERTPGAPIEEEDELRLPPLRLSLIQP